MKKILATILCIGMCSTACASIVNTQSFGIFEGDIGVGKFADQSSVPFGFGGGYQWLVDPSMTAGVEGQFLWNGNVPGMSSYMLTPLLSMYYYPAGAFNLFAKIGYGYQTDNYDDNTTMSQWLPIGILGMGYVIPFSNSVYANVFTDVTWVDESSNNASSFAGNQLTQNIQFKVGVQLMF